MDQGPLNALLRHECEDQNEEPESSRAERTRKRQACDLAEVELAWIAEDDVAANQQNATVGLSSNLQFIAETGTAKPKGASRSVIRSHARRPKSLAPVQRGSRVTTVSIQSRPIVRPAVQGASNEVAVSMTRDNPKSPQQDVYLTRGLATSSINSFEPLLVQASVKFHNLFPHWDRFLKHSQVVGRRKEWLSFAISDPAVFNVTLALAAMDAAIFEGKTSNPALFHYIGQTIRVVYHSLSKSDSAATKSTILAIAVLACLELLLGSKESSQSHIAGLFKLVESCGGINELGDRSAAKRVILWADNSASILFERKTFWEACHLEDRELEPNPGLRNRLAEIYKMKLSNLSGSSTLSEETIDIFWQLRNMSRLKEEAAQQVSPPDKIGNVLFSSTFARVEYRLGMLIRLQSISALTQKLSIYVLFGMAGYLHSTIFGHDFSRRMPLCNILSSRLRTVLEKTDWKLLEVQYPEMMLWIYIVAGLAGNSSSEEPWFATKVAEFCIENGLVGGDDIALALQEFLWTELYRSPVTLSFWSKVATAQGFEARFDVKRLNDRAPVRMYNAPMTSIEE